MTELEHEHVVFQARNAVRRTREAIAQMDAQPMTATGVAPHDSLEVADPVEGEFPITDEWAALWRHGFWQSAEGDLMLRPLYFFPGILAHVHEFGQPFRPAPNRALWAKWTLYLGSTQWTSDTGTTTTGWNALISSAKIDLVWASPGENLADHNVIFPSIYTNSMPAGNTLIWHEKIGGTNGTGRWAFSDQHDEIHGILMPSFL